MTTPNAYLKNILEDQILSDDSPELDELREHRKDVENLLTEKLAGSPHIRHGGSRAKSTLIRESYDLDIIVYFDRDDSADGDTIAELYEAVYQILRSKYYTEQKNCSIRLKSTDPAKYATGIHIDVVPGRYVDEKRSDCFLHQTTGEKERLKTNLQTHIDHIKYSEVTAAIRLLKLWKARRVLNVKTFALELLVIEILADHKKSDLETQLEHFWQTLEDTEDPITIKDPANPEGNDLGPLLAWDIWLELQQAARETLWQIENNGWEAVFGTLDDEETESQENNSAWVSSAIASVPPSERTRPWASIDDE